MNHVILRTVSWHPQPVSPAIAPFPYLGKKSIFSRNVQNTFIFTLNVQPSQRNSWKQQTPCDRPYIFNTVQTMGHVASQLINLRAHYKTSLHSRQTNKPKEVPFLYSPTSLRFSQMLIRSWNKSDVRERACPLPPPPINRRSPPPSPHASKPPLPYNPRTSHPCKPPRPLPPE